MAEPTILPTLASIKWAIARYNTSRSQVYRDLSAGRYHARKNGKTLSLDVPSMERYHASLPVAEFRAPPSKG
jgi:hypothetical protein